MLRATDILIKRKLSKDEINVLIKHNVLKEREVSTRKCYEKELEIHNISEFNNLIESFGLKESRFNFSTK